MNTTGQLFTATLCVIALSTAWAGRGTGLGRGGGPGNHFAPQGPALIGEGRNRDHEPMRKPEMPASAPFGQAAPDQLAERTIEIRPDTRWVNVTRMETIRFVVNRDGAQKAFTWRFDTLPLRPFDLAEVAPEGALGQQQVTVYVARNRDLDGRGGR